MVSAILATACVVNAQSAPIGLLSVSTSPGFNNVTAHLPGT